MGRVREDEMTGSETAPNPYARLEAKLADFSLRGQWQADANRPQKSRKGPNGALQSDPVAMGKPHLWRWTDLQPLLQLACEEMPESNTARRALILTNPGLARGTTHTLLASIQIVRPGEVAWAHRHTINALRLSIQGDARTYTVVEARRLPMEPYDLLLTPSWSWHDHHNESDQNAIWMDGLDVPLALALNQNFYDELGKMSQTVNETDSFTPMMVRAGQGSSCTQRRPLRYPWAETKSLIDARSNDPVDPCSGRVFEFVNPETGGSVLPTIECSVQVLPPGFEGRVQRSTSSSTIFVIQGEGRTVLDDSELDWSKHDNAVIPNWTWHRHVNTSRTESVILFVMSDRPVLKALGYYREEREGGSSALEFPARKPLLPLAV